ncbi:dienelactone hydrolase family protein [Ktedonosporobacter rubrisoli]|uniref:Dienelactone hydrolase family protein n=1 Tax=Ktedonosporobacter rubrisoli TaxID=2509675 RepID=A0A4P6JPF4_KTERU|nr:dienelactone hydrolase family protein [Ktedonosporobacter rubrisoli]QBD76646.1 dienelactone hydrolase family protein [Ktedonosporobacter rubrisoli]
MKEFQVAGRTFSGYLALPKQSSGPGVLVLHAWWGLTKPFQQVCDRLAEAGFVALAPDLYQGKTATTIEDAKSFASALNQDEERVIADITGAVQFLHQHNAPHLSGNSGKLGLIGFSLGGGYAFDTSVNLAGDIAAVVSFYATYPGLDYSRAQAAYLCHFAEDDPFEPAESVAQMVQELQATGRSVTSYTYPGTKHWFFEENRPEYDALAARLAWERTIAFLHERLD